MEGTYGRDGAFRATQILAKHSEEYRPPADGTHEARYRELIKSLNGRPTP